MGDEEDTPQTVMTTRAPAVLIKRQQKSLTNVAKIVWPIVLLQKLVRCMIAFDEATK